jgi:hypothetical protein
MSNFETPVPTTLNLENRWGEVLGQHQKKERDKRRKNKKKKKDIEREGEGENT